MITKHSEAFTERYFVKKRIDPDKEETLIKAIEILKRLILAKSSECRYEFVDAPLRSGNLSGIGRNSEGVSGLFHTPINDSLCAIANIHQMLFTKGNDSY
jgi:hypothetical protein